MRLLDHGRGATRATGEAGAAPVFTRKLRRAAWALAGQLLVSVPAHGAPAATEKAAAEALFEEGTKLMAEQKFDAACAKFEASGAIENGLGIKLWLADCYDRMGRTASAWGLFSEAAALAHQSGQADRERAANERALDLEHRLSKLAIKTPPGGLPAGVVVTLNGVAIPLASLGTPLPVDPGAEHVVLRAPGYRVISLERDVPQGPSSFVLEVPRFEPESRLATPAAHERPAAAPANHPKPGATQRTLGYSVGGLGVLSLAGAGLLAYRAHSLDTDSHAHCLTSEPNACDSTGASLRGEAINYGNVATGAVLAGAALTVTGVVLLLTAPSAHAPDVRVDARLAPNGGFVAVTGRL
jgi:hypothetical protein